MAQLAPEDVAQWLEDGARSFARRRWGLLSRRGRPDVMDAVRSFSGAAKGLDRGSLKDLAQRIAQDAELRSALAGITAAIRDLPGDVPRTSLVSASRAARGTRFRTVALVAGVLGAAALAAKLLRDRRGKADTSRVFDAHISQNGSSVGASDAKAADKG